MGAPQKCSECGSSSIVEDRQQGHAVCRDCGAVVESSFIVSDVQFEETSGGGIRALGTMVGATGVNQVGGINGVSGFSERRNLLMSRARDEIRRIASSLQFNEDAVAQAANFYEMALNRRLTQGIRWVKSLSACIYIVARLRNMPVMLLDLSDAVHVNVWDLGQVYNKITRALFLTIPLQDPSLLIMRFAQRLELNENTQRVMNTAVRICQRMNRDWMHIGRRPSGLCGSALLAACRYHGFNRTFEEFAEMVCISTSTLKLRMKEFADTPAGKMELGDFLKANDDDIADEQLPPVSKMHKKLEEQTVDEDLLEQTRQFQVKLEEILEDRQMQVAMRFASSVKNEDVQRRFELTEEEMDILTEQISTSAVENMHDGSSTEHSAIAELDEQPVVVAFAAAVERTPNYVVPENQENDNFSDVDDDEIDRYLLKPEEIVRKTKKWVQENLAFLKESREKEKKRQEEEAEKLKNQAKNPKRQTARKRNGGGNMRQNAHKRLEDIMEDRKPSGKINYDILAQLNGGDLGGVLAGIPPAKKMKSASSTSAAAVKADATKRELKEDLKEITSLVHEIKQDMSRVKQDPDLQQLRGEGGGGAARHDENDNLLDEVNYDEEDEDDDEADGAYQANSGMLSLSQMMSQEMGLDYGNVPVDEDY